MHRVNVVRGGNGSLRGKVYRHFQLNWSGKTVYLGIHSWVQVLGWLLFPEKLLL